MIQIQSKPNDSLVMSSLLHLEQDIVACVPSPCIILYLTHLEFAKYAP